MTNTIAESRWTTIEQIGSRFPWAFFMVVVAWLAVIFASFGLFAPRNASVVAALLVAALALAGPIFMMLRDGSALRRHGQDPQHVVARRFAAVGRFVIRVCTYPSDSKPFPSAW